jgi:hypothetical protein
VLSLCVQEQQVQELVRCRPDERLLRGLSGWLETCNKVSSNFIEENENALFAREDLMDETIGIAGVST